MISLERYRQSARLIQRGLRVLESCTTNDHRQVAQHYWESILAWHRKRNLPILTDELPRSTVPEVVRSLGLETVCSSETQTG
jgi:hypothetical protein